MMAAIVVRDVLLWALWAWHQSKTSRVNKSGLRRVINCMAARTNDSPLSPPPPPPTPSWLTLAHPLLQVQVDISTSAQVCTEIRRALSNFVEDNADQFVVGGSNVIFLDSQDPLKMTMGIVYTFPHNGEQSFQTNISALIAV